MFTETTNNSNLVKHRLGEVPSVFDGSHDVIEIRHDFGGQNTEGLLDDGFVVQGFSDQKFFRVGRVVEVARDSSEHEVRLLEDCEGCVDLKICIMKIIKLIYRVALSGS